MICQIPGALSEIRAARLSISAVMLDLGKTRNSSEWMVGETRAIS